ncbi:uncharacterized protein isoform X1 [Musca autumnalis]|uniref:uncharacterized protein isoform X1 n=1 Tax=Musca autumnalis TaxID=221902 RepID=UPI003CEB1251
MEIVNSSFRRQKFIKFYGEKDNPVSYILPEKPSLHEILLHEKHDFEAKVMRAATRKKWLKVTSLLCLSCIPPCMYVSMVVRLVRMCVCVFAAQIRDVAICVLEDSRTGRLWGINTGEMAMTE